MKKCLFAVLCCSMLPLWSGAAEASPVPCYDPAYFTPEKAARIRSEAAAQLPGLVREIDRLRAEFEALNAGDEFFNDRMRKRFEITGNLIRFIRRELAGPSTDAAMFARRGVRDLRAFAAYFKDELAACREANDKSNLRSVSVREFGAKGDGVADDTGAFEEAFEAVRNHPGRKVLRIPAGRYFLAGKAPNRSHWFLPGLENAEIAGEPGAEILFGDRSRMGIFLSKSRNVTVRDLVLNYTQPLFTQGAIESVDEKTDSFVIRLEPGRPEPRSGGSVCQTVDPGTKKVVNDASGKWIGKVEALPDNRYRLTVRRAFQNPLTGGLKPGQVFVMPFRYDDTKPLFLHEGAYCTFRKIRVTKAPNLVFAPHWVTGFNLIECEIVPEEGAYLSSNGDASHFGINTVNGIGPYLARCRFAAAGDDSVNVYGMGFPLYDSDVEAVTGRWALTDTLMTLVDPATGTIRWESECVKAEPGPEKQFRLFGADPVPAGLVSHASLKTRPLTTQELTDRSTGALRVPADPDTLYRYGISGTGTVITECEFPSNRNNGITIQSPNALIDSCTIGNMVNGIRAGGFLTWREGPPPYNLTIRNCTVRECRTLLETGYLTTRNGNAQCRPIRALTVENNRFEGKGELSFDNVEGLTFRNNRMDGSGRILLKNVGEAEIAGNTAFGAPLPPDRIVKANRAAAAAKPELVWPVRADLKGGLAKTETWRGEAGGLRNSGEGFEMLYVERYSALKELKLKASFRFADRRGRAGLRVIEHVGVPDNGYYFLLDGETGEFIAESRSRSNGNWKVNRVFLKKKLELREVNTMEVEAHSSRVAVSVNGHEVWRGGAPLPTLFRSGFAAFDAPVAVEALSIAGGGRPGGVLAFGDSITHHCRWQDELGKLAGVRIGNGGMACDDTVHARKRLESDVIALRPELVLILLGTNNSSVPQAVEDLKYIVGRLRDEKIGVVVCTLLPRPRPERVREINRALVDWCRKSGIPLHDWYEVLNDGSGVMKKEYGGGVHPNAAGVKAMARSFVADPEINGFITEYGSENGERTDK